MKAPLLLVTWRVLIRTLAMKNPLRTRRAGNRPMIDFPLFGAEADANNRRLDVEDDFESPSTHCLHTSTPLSLPTPMGGTRNIIVRTLSDVKVF